MFKLHIACFVFVMLLNCMICETKRNIADINGKLRNFNLKVQLILIQRKTLNFLADYSITKFTQAPVKGNQKLQKDGGEGGCPLCDSSVYSYW